MYTPFLQISVPDTATAAGDELPVEKTLSIWELITSGGPGGILIMSVLFILSIIAVYIFIERFNSIKKANKIDVNFINNIKDHVSQGRLDAAKALCQSQDTPVARMIQKGISRIGKPLKDITSAIENTGKLEISRLEKNLAALATIAGAAPMIGFLGTVIGMILAFHEMAAAGGQIDIEMLAEGIYTAMTTTVAGLAVGIVAYIGYNVLVARVDKVVYNMEANTVEFLDLLHEPA
ncbi:MotA/TolQ/ExbB proton channel family protein [Owenweeksia hongkongensis]|uniref:Biopolymer transport protein n=1 Tax=Owenweeksia hongkongensis (strain DSM 17368 / CIP 108786 / JCM 12287 / NRRL B-23963 / UST20020801) TaxID=926562 RepID=G8R142_OWEHD|nr:MotA/TolQ/ExbB proton channel family protein [Owenweeksia hongkongensis]AEV32757.1 biopolymer transport protein [Owenweeksia hongkongensis DSM 17368]